MDLSWIKDDIPTDLQLEIAQTAWGFCEFPTTAEWDAMMGMCPKPRTTFIYETGYICFLEWLFQNRKKKLIFKKMCQHGHLKSVQWMLELKHVPTNEKTNRCMLEHASRRNHPNFLRWCLDRFSSEDRCNHMRHAYFFGMKQKSMEVLRFLHSLKESAFWFTQIPFAAKFGHVEILDFMMDMKVMDFDGTLFYATNAAKHDAMKWALHHGASNQQLCLMPAVSSGSILSAQLLIEAGANPRTSNQLVSVACSHNYVELARFLITIGCAAFEENVLLSAKNGFLELIQMLKEMGFHFPDGVLSLACSNGHQDLAKWAIEEGALNYQKCITSCVQADNVAAFKMIAGFSGKMNADGVIIAFDWEKLRNRTNNMYIIDCIDKYKYRWTG